MGRNTAPMEPPRNHYACQSQWKAVNNSQRTYLNMPCRYATPIVVLNIALHWLVSKNIYYVSIIPYGPKGQAGGLDSGEIRSLAYSSLATFVSVLIGALMVCILLVLSIRWLDSEIPVTRSCSAVISAACHPPRHEESESHILGEMKWGETAPPAWVLDWFGVIEDGKGQCSVKLQDL